MKKIKFLFSFLTILLLVGCNSGDNGNQVIEKFEKKVNSVKSYSVKGTMEITSNEETYTYDVSVNYKYDNQYKVTLINTVNNHEQVILKNSDGVYVVTPALNKSFKFQSEWPDNSSQSYLLASLLKDIKSTKDAKVDKNKDYYIVNAKVNYPNNSNLVSEKIYFDKDNNLKEVQVLNKDGNAVITMKFNSIKYSDKFDKDNFNLDSLISTNECKGDENCNTNGLKEETTKTEDKQEKFKENMEKTNEQNEQSDQNKQNDNIVKEGNEQNNEQTTSILDNIVYPLYLPEDTHLSTKDTVDTDNGDRVIMTYAGAKPFMIIEEAASVSKEMEITSVTGDPLLLSMAVGALSSNSLEWQSNNVDYYITSSYLSSEELMTIAESLNTASVVEITNK